LGEVERCGVALAKGLDAIVARHHNGVFEARRGVGFMQGLRCRSAVGPVVDALLQAGLVVAPANDQVVRFLPPLIARDAEIEEALGIV
jgi:acetylornithine/N-succinyldiaminopimelate aminotransferase